MPSPEPKPAPAPAKVRNLTYENLRLIVEGKKQEAMAAVPEFEAVEVAVPARDAKGDVIKKNGFPLLEKQLVTKRSLIAAQWDEKIASLDA
jgi:hypothetical protein